MTPLIIAFGIFVALCIIGYALLVRWLKSSASEGYREELRRELERRERAHQPRRELRREHIEVTRKLLTGA